MTGSQDLALANAGGLDSRKKGRKPSGVQREYRWDSEIRCACVETAIGMMTWEGLAGVLRLRGAQIWGHPELSSEHA